MFCFGCHFRLHACNAPRNGHVNERYIPFRKRRIWTIWFFQHVLEYGRWINIYRCIPLHNKQLYRCEWETLRAKACLLWGCVKWQTRILFLSLDILRFDFENKTRIYLNVVDVFSWYQTKLSRSQLCTLEKLSLLKILKIIWIK